MADITASFNEIKIDGNNNKIYIGSEDKFVPVMKWMEEKVKQSSSSIGKRYIINLPKYRNVNMKINSLNIFHFLDDTYTEKYLIELHNNAIVNGLFVRKNSYFPEFMPKPFYLGYSSISCLVDEITMSIKQQIEFLEFSMRPIWQFNWDETETKEFENANIKAINNLNDIEQILQSCDIQFNIKKILLLSGEALIGKTHSFCDTAVKRIKNNQPTLLFFGHEFKSYKTIIENIVSLLGLGPLGEDEFLESLSKCGEEYNTRTLIMIDAINETENPKIWQDGIIKFCEQIKNYPNLALAMSIRDVEKNKIITPENEEYIDNEIVEVEHKGFEGIELEAVRTFCEALEVEFPKVPLHTYRLFVNPGMLFLYIESIKSSIKKVDTSIINPLTIFKSYVDVLERKYYQKYMHEVDEEDELVAEAVKEFIALGTQNDYLHFYLDYKEVQKKLKPLHKKILEFLISEGVLNKLKQEDETKVYFTYQKFENFFIADYLLGDFEQNKEKVFTLIREHHGAVSEALFMQIPETLGKEIFDLNVWFVRDRYIREQYLKSLVWRKPSTIDDNTFKYINFILGYEDLSSVFLDTALQLSNIPSHPLNMVRLHKYLLKFNMNERDYHWSIYLHYSYSDDGIVKRIINWAWDKKEEFEIEDESLYLYGLTLGWFLTSSNRELRDGTTKALVNLFTDNVNMFLKVLKEFETVDDLYVLERLYAVGYGIVLRSSNENGFKEFGEYVYQTVFNRDEVVEHICLRDYAKLTVEYINSFIFLEIDMKKVIPPYNQHLDWDLPNKNIDNIEKFRDDYSRIYFSVLKGDFKAYIIYPYVNHFLNLKIKNRPHPKTSKVRHDEFFNSLSEIQKHEYDKTKIESNEMLDILKFNDNEFENKLTTLKETKLEESNFEELLTSEQLQEYNDFIINYKQVGRYENGLDVKVVKRLVFLEVIKLGWDKELFKEFDNNANFDRNPDTGTERIGKKYQWIALYKILAKLLDTYEFKEDEYKEIISEYRGMYQFSFKRDIDPSTILRLKKEDNNKWWFEVDTTFENYELSDIEWMNSCEKLPKLSTIVDLTKNRKNYLLLDTNFSLDSDKERETYRNLYYHINSFIIKKDKEEEIIDWIKNQNFYARQMPDSKHFHDPYLREYPSSEAYNNIDNNYNSQPTWDNTFKDSNNNIPDDVLLTATGYFKERGELDHSITDSIEIKLPNKYFIDKMNLKQTLKDGEWINEQGEVVFLDPTVDSGNISTFNENGVLVADRKLLLEFLKDNDYTIIWILWGEKQVRNAEGFNNKDFLGIGEISGYGYFKGDEFIENINIKYDNN